MKHLAKAIKRLKEKIAEWNKRLRQASSDIKAWRKNNTQDKRERKVRQAKVKKLRDELKKVEEPKAVNIRIRIEDQLKRIKFLNSRINQRSRKIRKRATRKRHIKARLKFYVAKKTKLRKKWKKAKEKHNQGKNIHFESWMLNGCPNVLSNEEEEALAYVVVVHDQVCTATSNGGHATGSYHYYSPCRAFDCAGVYYKMQECQRGLRSKYGNGFRELFGPDGWYIKNGYYVGSQFPGHTDHNHVARNF